MKVLIATPYFYPRVGGLELYAEAIAHQLVGAGWEVHVVTSAEEAGTEQYAGMTIHRLKAAFVLSNTPVNPLWHSQLRHLIAKIAPDVINVHAPVPTMALAVSAAAGKTPVVVTYHAGSMRKGKPAIDALINVYEGVLLPRMLNRATHIITASDFVRNSFLAKWQDKSTTVTPGVDVETFVPAKKTPTEQRLLFVGDFRDPRKGLSVLLDAMRQLPDVTLEVVGQGPAKVQKNVVYSGVKRGSELVERMQAATMLVLPSTTDAESFGMVLIEAMACGLPVIGSRIGGISYVINDGQDGLLVPAGNPYGLAQTIRVLTGDRKYAAKLGKAGRRKVEQSFTWTSRGELTDQILRRAITTAEVSRG